MVQTRSEERIPENMQDIYKSVVALTDAFCKEKLSEEYAQLSRKLAATLARKRPSPLSRGKQKNWACGIVYALGFVNFLFDKNHEPYVTATELCEGFGVEKNMGYNKSREIRKILKMHKLDSRWSRWCLRALLDKKPKAWMYRKNNLFGTVNSLSRRIPNRSLEPNMFSNLPDQED